VALRRLACFWLSSVLASSAAVVVAVMAALAADDPAPRAVIDAPVHEFGSVEQGTPVEHVFRVRNAGTGVLRVDHVKSTCACTVGVATGEAIAPGEEAWVTMRLETEKLAGRTTKTATVYTNDPATPTLGVTLSGDVLTDLVVRPMPLYFGRIANGARVRRELAVAPGRPNGTATVVAVEAPGPRLRAWLEAAADGRGQRVVVEVDGSASTGRFSDELVLRTSSASQPTLTVKVLGTIGSPRG
jgi:hypothetical protein